MEREIGYVVVEFNQASRQPSIQSDLYHRYDEAEAMVLAARDDTARIGRRERYAVGTVTIEEGDDD